MNDPPNRGMNNLLDRGMNNLLDHGMNDPLDSGMNDPLDNGIITQPNILGKRKRSTKEIVIRKALRFRLKNLFENEKTSFIFYKNKRCKAEITVLNDVIKSQNNDLEKPLSSMKKRFKTKITNIFEIENDTKNNCTIFKYIGEKEFKSEDDLNSILFDIN